MWFKNLQIYRLVDDFKHSAEEFHSILEENICAPVQGLDLQRTGWCEPLGKNGYSLVHESSGCLMICAKKYERVLPNAVVKDVLEDKISEIEIAEARTVGRKEKADLKDEIVIDLLPKAFVRSSSTYAYIDRQEGWVVVDSSSFSKAEELLELIRKSLSHFRTRPIEVNDSPSEILTDWVKTQSPADFDLKTECELRDLMDEGTVVRCKGLDVQGEEIALHLSSGKQVVKIATSWNERLSCVLTDDLAVKRLKFLDGVQEEVSYSSDDDYATKFDADFSIMTLELRGFINRLINVYGGLTSLDS